MEASSFQTGSEWEKYCTDCAGRPKAASKNCCEQQVRAEQQGFNDCTNQCGKYDQANWGPSAGGLTGKVMPGWDPSWDFNDYEKRVEFGLKLCCPNNKKK